MSNKWVFSVRNTHKLIMESIKQVFDNPVININEPFTVHLIVDNVIVNILLYDFYPPSLLMKQRLGKLTYNIITRARMLQDLLRMVQHLTDSKKIYSVDIDYHLNDYRGWYVSSVSVVDNITNIGLSDYFINGDILMFKFFDINFMIDKFKKSVEVEFFPNKTVKFININPLTVDNVKKVSNIINTVNGSTSIDLSMFTRSTNDGFLNIRFNGDGDVVMFDLVVGNKYFSCKKSCDKKIQKVYKQLR